MSYQDKSITCIDCNAEFIFTAGEQEFHASKGFTREPRRCPSCRAARKNAAGGPRPDGNGADNQNVFAARPQRQMYAAVCASCGKDTQVPFQPTGGRPVYCSDCFKANAPAGGQRSFGGGQRSGAPRPGGSSKPRFNNSGSGSFSSPRSNDRDRDSMSYGADFSDFPADFMPPPSGKSSRKRDNRNRDRKKNYPDYDNEEW